MNLKVLYTSLDIIFGTIWGFTILDLIPLVVVNGGNIVFSNIDNSIKVASALFGLIYFGFRIYFYYHKSKSEISLLKEQAKELELKNISTEKKQFVFREFIENMPEELYVESENRLKK